MRIALFLEALGRINSVVPILLLCREDVENGASLNRELEWFVKETDELDKFVLDLVSPNESSNVIVYTPCVIPSLDLGLICNNLECLSENHPDLPSLWTIVIASNDT